MFDASVLLVGEMSGAVMAAASGAWVRAGVGLLSTDILWVVVCIRIRAANMQIRIYGCCYSTSASAAPCSCGAVKVVVASPCTSCSAQPNGKNQVRAGLRGPQVNSSL
jgi:hypothetical protein